MASIGPAGPRGMAKKKSFIVAVALLAAAALLPGIQVNAEVVRWVDDAGITHFGDAYAAPLDARAETVEIEPANGMMVPTAPPATSRSGPRVVKLGLTQQHNTKGWRIRGESLYTGRRHISRGR